MILNPMVSIVIPVYNGNNYLREAIESALGQTYRNCEVIVVNDGSNDNGATEQIARSFGDRIRYFCKENGGVASALNFGIKEMQGHYFSWLSHDDVYYPEKVSSQVNRYSDLTSATSILYSDYDIIDSESRVIGSTVLENPPSPDLMRYSLMTSHPVNGCTTLIPRSCFDTCGLFNESLRTTQDYDMWFRLAGKFEFVHQPDRLIQSRHHSGQGTHAVKETHGKECDELLANFVTQTRVEDIMKGRNSSPGLAYAFLAHMFKKRGYPLASGSAKELSLRHVGTMSALDTLKTYYCLYLKR